MAMSDDNPCKVFVQIESPTSITANHNEFTVIATVIIEGRETSEYIFQQSRQDFLSATKDEQRYIIITKSIANVEIPFPLEKLRWGGLYFGKSRPEKLEEIEEQILELARICAENVKLGVLIIRMHKLKKQVEELINANHYDLNWKEALDDWIKDNKNDVNYGRYYEEPVFNLYHISPKENRYFGLKSVMVTENCPNSCSICLKDLKRGRWAIGFPCARHIFHGYCIIKWISKMLYKHGKPRKWYAEKLDQAFPNMKKREICRCQSCSTISTTNPTPTPSCPCPLCRFDLFTGKPGQDTTLVDYPSKHRLHRRRQY